MKRFGIVSYNINCNFTNYGSALQSWALAKSISKLGHSPVLIDYCPDILKDKDPLNPIKNMWDQDKESIMMCELSMPAIRINYEKFDRFYTNMFERTNKKYFSNDFENVVQDYNLDGFVCGSDTIFCVEEFGGMEDGYYANYDCMKNGYAVSYAASFGDSKFDENGLVELEKRMKNFKAIGIREYGMVPTIEKMVDVPVKKVVDPTLLLKEEEYSEIVSDKKEEEKYLLIYARRYNPKMSAYAEKIAQENGWKVVEISLRATNKDKHKMAYDAGVEEFLSLVKNAEFVVTNSFHGLIFSVQFRKDYVVFSREQADTKIAEISKLFGLSDRVLVNGDEEFNKEINYDEVHSRIDEARKESLEFLKMELDNCK